MDYLFWQDKQLFFPSPHRHRILQLLQDRPYDTFLRLGYLSLVYVWAPDPRSNWFIELNINTDLKPALNSGSHEAVSIIKILASLHEFVRESTLRKKLAEFYEFNESEKRQTI